MMQELKVIVYINIDNDAPAADLEEDITERVTASLDDAIEVTGVEFEYEE